MSGIVVLGDIFVDHVSDLSLDEHLVDGWGGRWGHDAVAPIAVRHGGGGLQFALAVAGIGVTDVCLIGKVGRDADGRSVGPVLAAGGVRPLLVSDPGSATGRAIIVYLPADRRLMVSDPGANATFGPGDVSAEMVAAARTASLMHVSGYVLLCPPRRAAALLLMRQTRDTGATVVLDLVPHDLDRHIDVSTVLPEVFATVDWVCTATVTGRRCLGLTATADADEISGALGRHGIRSTAVFDDPSRATVRHAGTTLRRTFDYPVGSDARGQSARAQARLVRDLVPRPGVRWT